MTFEPVGADVQQRMVLAISADRNALADGGARGAEVVQGRQRGGERDGAVDIAHGQGIARSTVIDHIRKVYRELNVGSAWELRQSVDEEMPR